MTGEDSEDEMDDIEDGIPMQGEDGQHYVVLEVIQLADQVLNMLSHVRASHTYPDPDPDLILILT